ncbi:MAG: ATP-binding protein [Clostridia bacterium]|nr:ATP-binding protein [Clostridia bacterium]
MKSYLCIPGKIFDKLDTRCLDMLSADFDKNLKKYFGAISTEVVRKNSIDAIEVYIMGKPKYSGFEKEIKEEIINLIKAACLTSDSFDVQIKMNYAAFNPGFKPCADEKTDDKFFAAKSNDNSVKREVSNEYDYEKLSYNYQAEEPRFSFEQVILPESTRKQIEQAIGILEVEHKVFDEWGLRSIIPEATSALSFYGPPGTGKSMSAEAVAKRLGKKILKATYADIESKYHGEGPKMVKAIFRAAEREDAVLFLDESDSLLSKRLTNVSDGSAQAINSMRSQLLISLEHFSGIVIFATNLVVNYDKAFLSRLINIEFTFPEKEERIKIWWNHLKSEKIRIPLSDDIDIEEIASEFELCGREIKNAVKNACITVALEKRDIVCQNDLMYAAKQILMERERVYSAKDQTNIKKPSMSEEACKDIKGLLEKKMEQSTV